jgi:D-serine deaminase-like pyridoxal phosphate-dependent protein
VQPGSFVVMDGQYNGAGMGGAQGFANALTVLTTVQSRPTADRAVVDCGAKGIDLVGGVPEVRGALGLGVRAYRMGGDEHGILDLNSTSDLPVGSVLELVSSHCDPTVNLHDYFVCHRNGMVEAVHPIAGRGPGL